MRDHPRALVRVYPGPPRAGRSSGCSSAWERSQRVWTLSDDNEPSDCDDDSGSEWWKRGGRAIAWFLVAAPGWWPIIERFL